MYHSLFTALFLVSSVLADGFVPPVTPTSTTPAPPAGNVSPPVPAPAPSATPTSLATAPVSNTPPVPKAIAASCSQFYFPFSERDIAELDPEDKTVNKTTLSDEKTAAICQSPGLNAVCTTQSCTPTFPTCSVCLEYIPNDKNFTLGTVTIPSMLCNGNYNFNSTNVETPYLCGTTEKEYSCKSCVQTTFVSCTNCYDMKDIPSS